MKNFCTALLLASIATCSSAQTIFCSGGLPVFQMSTAVDSAVIGRPGAAYIGVEDPAYPGSPAAFFTSSGVWESYAGGLWPYAQVFYSGLPATLTVSAPLHSTTQGAMTTTSQFVGWRVYVGYGALTAEAEQMIVSRRVTLDAVRPERIAAGTWNAEYDDDEKFRYALVMKDMTQAHRHAMVLEIPFIDCSPSGG